MPRDTSSTSSALETDAAARHEAHAAVLISRMEAVPFSRWHAKARIVMGSATFFDAFDALSLAFALPVLVGLWDITPARVGLLIGSTYVGQLVGALLFSWLAERIGRIRSATGAVAIMSVMGVWCAFTNSFPALLMCRVIQGIGIGGEMPVAAAYISELSRAKGRGRFFMLYELIFPIGLAATGQIAALVVPAFGWRALFLVGGVPGMAIAVALSRLHESPRWLIARGRLQEAEAIIQRLEASTPLRSASPPAPDAASPRTEARPTLVSRRRARWADLLGSDYRSRTLIVWALWASAYFVANSLNNWMPTLYNTLYQLELRQSLRAAAMTNIAQVIVLLICAFSIDRIGRRKWAVLSFTCGGTLLGLLGIFGTHSVTSVMILATISYGIIGSVNAVLYLYTPEIYPTRMRAVGTGVATSWLRLASAVGPTIVGVLVGRRGISSVFLMFAAVCVLGALAASRMLETQNRRLEDIAS